MFDVSKVNHGDVINAVEKMLVISTSHVTSLDGRMLDEQGEDLAYCIHSDEYGSLFTVPQDHDPFLEMISYFRDHTFSEAFLSAFVVAKHHGISWIKFDRDGYTIGGMEVFNW